MLAVGKLLLRCRLLGGARRFGAHMGGEGRGHIVAAARLQLVMLLGPTLCGTCPIFIEFCENLSSSFRVILLTNKQTNKQSDNITSLADN